MLAFIIGVRGHVGAQALRAAAPSRASSWLLDPSLPPVPRRAPEAGDEQGRDTARISGEGDCCPYFQRPVTLAFPRVLELQKKQGPVRSGTRAVGLHREEAEAGGLRVQRGSLELPPHAE